MKNRINRTKTRIHAFLSTKKQKTSRHFHSTAVGHFILVDGSRFLKITNANTEDIKVSTMFASLADYLE